MKKNKGKTVSARSTVLYCMHLLSVILVFTTSNQNNVVQLGKEKKNSISVF